MALLVRASKKATSTYQKKSERKEGGGEVGALQWRRILFNGEKKNQYREKRELANRLKIREREIEGKKGKLCIVLFIIDR